MTGILDFLRARLFLYTIMNASFYSNHKGLMAILAVLSYLPLGAQDPGYQPPVTESRSAPSATEARGGTSMAASGLNSMDVLDNVRAIRPGDVISLRIIEDRKEPRQVTVGVTGEIQAPYVGLVKAAGRTSRSLADSIKVELERSYFKKATVIVAIDQTREESRGPGIYNIDMEFFTVFGQVLRQGKYELPSDEDVTISQAILRAGGFAQFGNPKRVKVVRQLPDGQNKTILVNCDDIMRKGNLNKDIYIRSGDVVIVDEKKVSF
jgi:protein involved in polysaccharide export with SLBB domain